MKKRNMLFLISENNEKMKRVIIFLFFVFVISSCENKTTQHKSVINSTIEVDADKVAKHLTPNLSEIFTPLKIISLETTKESILKRIDKLKFFNDNIYVLDSNGAKALMVFSNSGKFKYKVGNAGDGPGEYVLPLDFEVDTTGIRILSLDKVVTYDLKGKFIRNIRFNFAAQYFASVGKNYDVYYGDSREDRIILTNKSGKRLESFFRYSPRNRLSSPSLLSQKDTSAYFSIPLCDTIFRVTSNQITPYCFIDFGPAAFTHKDYENLPNGSKMSATGVVSNSQKYAMKHIYSETEQCKFLSFTYQQKHIGCIIDKSSNNRIYYNINDSNDDVWFSQVRALPLSLLENNKLAFVVDYPDRVMEAKKVLRRKVQRGVASDSEKKMLCEMEDACSGIDEFSNPVIFIAKLNDKRKN